MADQDQPDDTNEIDRLIAKLEANPAVDIKHISKTSPRQSWPDTLHDYPDLLAFYRQLDEVKLSWRVKEMEAPDYSGGLTVISSLYFDDGKTPFFLDNGEFWMVNGEERVLVGKFFPIELIEDNAAVGVFSTEGISKAEVYYFDFGINFYSLQTDWPGYMQLLEMSFAVRYWQTAIVEWEYGDSSSTVGAFGEILDRISAGISLEDFKAFYETIKKDFK